MKSIALAIVLSASPMLASALEPIADDSLADTVGQSGLTFTGTTPSLSASSVRYYDSDGMSAAGVSAYGIAASPVYLTSDGTSSGTPLPGPCGGLLNLTCVNKFGAAGASINFNDFSVSSGTLQASMDVGSTGTGSSASSGILLGLQVSGLNINLGGISIDNGDELRGVISSSRAPTNAPVYASNGVLTSGQDFGGVALTQFSMSHAVALVTPGASGLGRSSGMTITGLSPLSMQFNFVYYNTGAEAYSGGSFTPATGHSTNDGLLVVPVFLTGVNLGPVEVAVGTSGGGYSSSSSQALDFDFSGATIGLMDFGGEALGASGIQIDGTDFGSISLQGVKIAPMKVSFSGH